MTILANKGMVTRTKQGREFIYSPAGEKTAAASSALRRLLDVFFNGSVSDAVAASFSGAKEQIDELRLRNVPLEIALRYICNKTGMRYKVDEYVVTF